jgi:hypothetical protein
MRDFVVEVAEDCPTIPEAAGERQIELESRSPRATMARVSFHHDLESEGKPWFDNPETNSCREEHLRATYGLG